MDNSQVINIMDKYFNTTELFGNVRREELHMLLQLMFIDEYYEVHRDESLNNPQTTKGLTDDMVRKLNTRLQYIMQNSKLFTGVKFSSLHSMNYWIIPSPTIHDYEVVEHALRGDMTITEHVAQLYGTITNHIFTP